MQKLAKLVENLVEQGFNLNQLASQFGVNGWLADLTGPSVVLIP